METAEYRLLQLFDEIPMTHVQRERAHQLLNEALLEAMEPDDDKPVASVDGNPGPVPAKVRYEFKLPKPLPPGRHEVRFAGATMRNGDELILTYTMEAS